jgi:hypothetical protein
MKVPYIRFFWIATLFLFLLGCEKDQSPLNSGVIGFTYPLKTGLEWHYVGEMGFFNIRGDSALADSLLPDTTYFTGQTRILDPVTQPDGKHTIAVLTQEVGADSTIYSALTYYLNEKDGLYIYGYDGALGKPLIPKPAQTVGIRFKHWRFTSFSDFSRFARALVESTIPGGNDSTYVENPPVCTLKYPLWIGKEWVYRLPDHPFAMNKKVVKDTMVEVPAGTFSCLKLQYFHDIDGDGKWDEDIDLRDYLNQKGLIQREAVFKNVVLTTSSGQNPILVNSYFRWRLESTNF